MWYLSGCLIFFCYWLTFFIKDRTTPNHHLISWVVLLTASLLWPVSAPLSMIELIGKAKSQKNKPDVIEAGEITR